LNKLAILAFTLLVFFSTMLWYLANGSLNEYLKSQVELQGYYYSGQTTTLDLAEFSPQTGITTFDQLNLTNLNNYQAQHVLVIDKAQVELSQNENSQLLLTISKVSINKLTLNLEQKPNEETNIEKLTQRIRLKLANDYPQLYPEISAKLYAENNPELSADKYAASHPQSGPMVEHTKQKKKRDKPQQKIIISAINIKTIELNTIENGVTNSITKHNVNISTVGNKEGFEKNQIGGEFLLRLLNLVK